MLIGVKKIRDFNVSFGIEVMVINLSVLLVNVSYGNGMEKFGRLEDIMGDFSFNDCIMMGDFNARIGEFLGLDYGAIKENDCITKERRSMDR